MSWRRFLERQRRDDDAAREIESYLQHETDERLARGFSPSEARQAALRKFGSTTYVKETVYQMNTLTWLDTAWRDLKYAARQLRRNPVFAFTAVLSLALGIGANTAIFTLTDQILLRLLPVKNPHELVQMVVEGGRVGSQSGDGLHTFSHPAYLAIRDRNTVFTGVAGQVITSASLLGAGSNELVNLGMVSGNFFDVFGVPAYRGRLLTPDDDRVKNGGPVVVLEYDFWRNRYEGKPEVIGSTIRLNGAPFTVIGIAAPGFEGTNVGYPTHLWVPVTMKPTLQPSDTEMENERYTWFGIFARLKPDVSMKQAEAAMRILWRQRQEEEVHGEMFQRYPVLRERFFKQVFGLEPAARGQSALRGRFEGPLLLLQCLVGAVLLIACSNVAGLLLARAAVREREMAIRGSLGAGRARLIRQMLLESLALACAGGLAGVILSRWITTTLVKVFAADPTQLSLTTAPDSRVLLFATALTVITTLLFGMLPAWQSSRAEPAATLKESGSAVGGTQAQVRLRKVFVAFQVALSTVLLIGAGLFARSLSNLRQLDLGMKTENVAMFSVRPALLYDDARKQQVYRSLFENLGRVQGVIAVGANTTQLYTGGRSDGSFTLTGVRFNPADPMVTFFNMITPGYFEALEIRVKAGRDLSWRDWGSGRKICLINEELVSKYLKDRNPVGLMLGRQPNAPPDYEIAGVIGNARYHDVRGEFPPQMFYNMDSRLQFANNLNVFARVRGDAHAVMAQLRKAVQEVDANLVVTGMRTLDEQIDLRLANERMLSFLFMGFAVLAALLAVTGLYGVLAFVVTRRNREIGIRVALGAGRGRVIGLVLGEMTAVIGLGIAAGIGGGVLCGRLAQSQLYQVRPFDLTVFVTAACVLAVAALAAALLPAWRASRLDPMTALRPE